MKHPFYKHAVSFLLVVFLFDDIRSQTYMAPLNIEIQKPKIKITELNDNLDVVVHERIIEFFASHQKLFNVIDRRAMSAIEEERSVYKSKASGNFESAAMYGTQVMIESAIKNVKEKIDSACVVTDTPKGKIGNLNIVDTKISGCSLYIMTYSFVLELTAIDVETGAVIETISLTLSTEGKIPYHQGKKDRSELRKDCMRRMQNCFTGVLKESSLFITKINIPVIGIYKANDKKLEAKELIIEGFSSELIPFGLDLEIIEIAEEKINNDVIKRQVVVANGRMTGSPNGHFLVDVSKGGKEVYDKLTKKESLYVRLGKNMINKTCNLTLPK